MRVQIKRKDGPDEESYWQTFLYEKNEIETVAGIIEHLNYRDDLVDVNNLPCRRIRWECSCMQKMGGACAMVVNHEPVLACNTFINPQKTELLVIEPLTKFPVITDLCVDRSCIREYLKEAEMYLGKYGGASEKEFSNQYQVGKCLKCGLCLEVCPNYTGYESNFYGAVFANESYLLHSSTEDRKKEIKKQYQKHFEKGCSKSLACRDICPAKIPTLSSIGYMNKLKK